MAPFSASESNLEALPPVTMVFCAIENGKQYAGWHRADAQVVHNEMSALMRSILRQIPGGYFVRRQDGELRYLLVFRKPEASLEL